MEPERFVFRKHDNIGANAAEDDDKFLEHCFHDTGELPHILDCKDPKRIIVGRSGCGKTAILAQIKPTCGKIISIKPESLALSYISNSTILNFVSQLGVGLDIFFRLLWRHVLAVEIIKVHFEVKDERTKIKFIDAFRLMFTDKKHQQALKYLEEWGKTFWEETDYRIKELTTKLEKSIAGEIGANGGPVVADLVASASVTEEIQREVVKRAQKVVNEVQIRELSDVVELLDDVLKSKQNPYYIVIDRLDENWVDDKIRYQLIRALIETVRDFKKVSNTKVVIALRRDLIERVFARTRDAGFQQEKYDSLFLEIRWNNEDLKEFLDKRIDFLICSRYTRQMASHQDIFSGSIAGKSAVEYMLDRTFGRPRDLIAFFNTCIRYADGKAKITSEIVKQAEGEYSEDRLRSISEEWFSDYPNLRECIPILKHKNHTFNLSSIGDEELGNVALAAATHDAKAPGDPLFHAATDYLEDRSSATEFASKLIRVFYQVGIVGLKLEATETIQWSIDKHRPIHGGEITGETRVSVHKCFWRALCINTPPNHQS